MEVYISELDIETYRGIKNLKMENLAPINIITGDNNSGKTSVLELLQSVKNPGSFRVWRELLSPVMILIGARFSIFKFFIPL